MHNKSSPYAKPQQNFAAFGSRGPWPKVVLADVLCLFVYTNCSAHEKGCAFKLLRHHRRGLEASPQQCACVVTIPHPPRLIPPWLLPCINFCCTHTFGYIEGVGTSLPNVALKSI